MLPYENNCVLLAMAQTMRLRTYDLVKRLEPGVIVNVNLLENENYTEKVLKAENWIELTKYGSEMWGVARAHVSKDHAIDTNATNKRYFAINYGINLPGQHAKLFHAFCISSSSCGRSLIIEKVGSHLDIRQNLLNLFI